MEAPFCHDRWETNQIGFHQSENPKSENREIFERNLSFSNIENIHCSMWSDAQLEIFEIFNNLQYHRRFFRP